MVSEFDEHPCELTTAKAKFASRKFQNARNARLDHLDKLSLPETKFLESVRIVGVATNRRDSRRLSRTKHFERNKVVHWWVFLASRIS